VLGDHGSVDLSGVGEAHIAGNQLGKHQLMNGSSSGMDPAQVPRCAKLLRTKLPTYQNLRITNVVDQPIEAVELNKVVLRKFALQTWPKPIRSVPEFKPMVNREQDFHGRQSQPAINTAATFEPYFDLEAGISFGEASVFHALTSMPVLQWNQH